MSQTYSSNEKRNITSTGTQKKIGAQDIMNRLDYICGKMTDIDGLYKRLDKRFKAMEVTLAPIIEKSKKEKTPTQRTPKINRGQPTKARNDYMWYAEKKRPEVKQWMIDEAKKQKHPEWIITKKNKKDVSVSWPYKQIDKKTKKETVGKWTVTKELGQRWRNLSVYDQKTQKGGEERLIYVELHNIDVKRYEKELEAFKTKKFPNDPSKGYKLWLKDEAEKKRKAANRAANRKRKVVVNSQPIIVPPKITPNVNLSVDNNVTDVSDPSENDFDKMLGNK